MERVEDENISARQKIDECGGKKLRQDAHVGIIFLKQLSHGLQDGNQELSRFTQHPTRLCNEDAKEDSTDFKLILSSTVSYCEVLWNLST